MNYLIDNGHCTIGGMGPKLLEEVRLAILVEDGHIIFFLRSRKSGVIRDALLFGSLAVAVTVGVVGIPVALAAWAADSAITKMDKPNLIATYNKIKVKFKLSDEEIFISHPQKCSVELSDKNSLGGNSLLNPRSTVFIKGIFMAGEKEKDYRIWFENSMRPNAIVKIFNKGNFPVSFVEQ